jgi:hypothetical protein
VRVFRVPGLPALSNIRAGLIEVIILEVLWLNNILKCVESLQKLIAGCHAFDISTFGRWCSELNVREPS